MACKSKSTEFNTTYFPRASFDEIVPKSSLCHWSGTYWFSHHPKLPAAIVEGVVKKLEDMVVEVMVRGCRRWCSWWCHVQKEIVVRSDTSNLFSEILTVGYDEKTTRVNMTYDLNDVIENFLCE